MLYLRPSAALGILDQSDIEWFCGCSVFLDRGHSKHGLQLAALPDDGLGTLCFARASWPPFQGRHAASFYRQFGMPDGLLVISLDGVLPRVSISMRQQLGLVKPLSDEDTE